jgi:hypothetical protein
MDSQALNSTAVEIFTQDIPDEALELAACVVKERPVAFTAAFCSGLDTCPA